MVMWYQNTDFDINDVWKYPIAEVDEAMDRITSWMYAEAWTPYLHWRYAPALVTQLLSAWADYHRVMMVLNNECGLAPGCTPPDIRPRYQRLMALISQVLEAFEPNDSDYETVEEALADGSDSNRQL